MKSKIAEYECFNDLAAARQRGRDYDIETRERSLDIIFIAPHGGRIEPETEHFARHLAGDDFSFHVFESYLPTGANNLHITSHHYDEPSALDLVQRCRIGVGFHGRRSLNPNDVEIWMGGLNRDKVLDVSERLKAVGFETRTEGHDFRRNTHATYATARPNTASNWKSPERCGKGYAAKRLSWTSFRTPSGQVLAFEPPAAWVNPGIPRFDRPTFLGEYLMVGGKI